MYRIASTIVRKNDSSYAEDQTCYINPDLKSCMCVIGALITS